MNSPTPETLIARQVVVQIGAGKGQTFTSDVLSGRYDFSTEMLIAKATVALTLELSDRVAVNSEGKST